MSIVNRRNAAVGWVVVKAGKYAVKKKASDTASVRNGAVAGGLAAVAGALLFWKKRAGGSDE